MDALIAIFSFIYIFWPLILFLGLREFLDKGKSFSDRLRLGIRRIFIAWFIWSLIYGFLHWQGRQPLLIMPEKINNVLFIILGLFTGSISLTWAVFRWRGRWIRLSALKERDDLLALSPERFEALIAALFRAYGHSAQVSGGNSDHGVDVIVQTNQGEKWIVQCKRYSGSVGEPIIRDLYGTMGHENAQRAYLITTGSFTSQAVEWSVGKPIILYDGDALVKLIRRTKKRSSKLLG